MLNLSHTLSRRRAVALSSVGLLVALSGCGGTGGIQEDPQAAEFGTIKISKGLSQETETVANIYARALQEAGYSVEIVDTGDTREDYLNAMGGLEEPEASTASASPTGITPSADPATVDLTPDYSGNLLYELTDDGAFSTAYIEQQRKASAEATQSASAEATSAESAEANEISTVLATPSPQETSLQAPSMSSSDILDSIDRLLPSTLQLLAASDGQNRDALVVTQATAAKYELNSMTDLSDYCKKLTFGVTLKFSEKPYGLKALSEYYQCKPKAVKIFDDQTELSQALASNEVQVADIYSASSQISQNAYKVLEDTEGIFIPQQIVPIMRVNELPSSAQNAVNTVSRQITTDDLKTFDRLTHGSEAMTPEEVAKFWLDRSTE